MKSTFKIDRQKYCPFGWHVVGLDLIRKLLFARVNTVASLLLYLWSSTIMSGRQTGCDCRGRELVNYTCSGQIRFSFLECPHLGRNFPQSNSPRCDPYTDMEPVANRHRDCGSYKGHWFVSRSPTNKVDVRLSGGPVVGFSYSCGTLVGTDLRLSFPSSLWVTRPRSPI